MHKPWYSFLYIKSPISKIVWGIATVLISFAALVVLGFRFEERRMAAQTDNWHGRSIEKGAELFYNNCRSCHGEDGRGLPSVAPALHSRYFFTQRLTDVGYTGSLHDYVASTLTSGRPSKAVRQWAQMMPTWSEDFGGPLRSDQIEHLTNFILNWEQSALAQSWEPDAPNMDPWQPFRDGPSKAEQGTITHTVGALGVMGVTAGLTGTTTTTAATAAPAGPRSPAQLFVDMGCLGCHKLGPHEVGVTGPDLNTLPETAASKVAGQDATTYVYTSITDPNVFINEGFQAGIMPANFKERMSEEEIQALVQWLLDPNRTY
jgi:mono/diheme cytochrome c family protein